MKLRLTILWLLVSGIMAAQPEFTLKSGEQLSHLNQYGRSTQELEAFIQANPTRLYDQSQALLLISYNHMQLGDYANALAANEKSLRIKAQLHADDLVNNYVRFGAIHLLRGNHHAALSYLLKAKDYPIEAIQLYAIIDGYLAATYQGLGQFEQSEIYYRQSIETLLIEYPENHPNIITTYYNLGKLYMEWEKPELARQYLLLGLDRSETSSEQAFLQALLNNGLGETYPNDPRRAENYHRKALDIATEFFGGYHRETALASLLLAKVIYRQNRRDEARDAIQLAIRSLNPEQPNLTWTQMPDTSRLVIDRPLLAEALGFRARWLMDSALPEEQKFSLALVNSEMAAQLLETSMDHRIDQFNRLELLPIARQALEGGIQAGIQMWKDRKDENAQKRAFQLAERIKVLKFRAYTGHTLQLTGTFADRERTMLRTLRLAEMEFRLQPLDLTVSREVYRLRENYRRMKEDWKKTEPLAYQQRFGMERQSLSELQEGLTGDHALFSYFIGEHQTFVFTITRSGMQTFAIDASDLPASIDQFNKGIDSTDIAVLTAQGYQLYQRLLQPAASILKGKNKLSLVPDAYLESLPFEALLTGAYRKKQIRLHKLPYLIKEMAIDYRHTATAWKMPTGEATAAYEFLFVSPVFDLEPLARIPANRRVLFDPNVHNPTILADDRHFKLVKGATAEASDLQVIWGESAREGRFKLREAATESLVMQEIGRAHYLHLATYAFVQGPSPEEAGLVLANTELGNTVANDGFLLASELETNPISATDLLSVNFVEMGEDAADVSLPILPLSGSCMLSGIPHLLYNTRLQGETSFFPSFYKYLLEDTSVRESLQQVKIDFAKDKATAAPLWWSGYRLLSN